MIKIKKTFKKAGADLIAAIICIVLIASFAIVVMTNQKKSSDTLMSTVKEESFLF